ncbi:MAG: hypothetical protein AB1465_04525 [Patescibacteria group bacterium]
MLNIYPKNQPFHVLSRAVDEKRIFEDKSDCYRFIFQLYAANIGKPAFNLQRKDMIKVAQAILQGEKIPPKFIIEEHPPLVDFLDFALVITHFHFYLVPNFENCIPTFIKKLNIGFAKYFNLKNNRKGALFGARYQSIPVKTDFQSSAVSRYISVINPLDIYQPGWRKKGLKNWKKAFNFLEDYQFSSFPDRIGKRKSKILAPEETLKRFCLETDSRGEGKNRYKQFVRDFLKQKALFQKFFLE